MAHWLIAILGPTAVGKTALSLELAEEFHGEIVSADSRQVFRGMDIGTAKPTPAEQRRVPHHLIDLVNPGEPFTLSQFQSLAYATIDDIHRRGKLPFLVGGSGLYVRAVLEGLEIPRVPPNPALRAELDSQPTEFLYARLQEMDPSAAEQIGAGNKRRLIRALEVCQAAGKPISALQTRRPPGYDLLRIGLTLPRDKLYERINARVDAMVAAGLEDEVRALLAQGYPLDTPAMSGLGYRQIALAVKGKLTLDQAVELLKRDTRRFVHHQYSWFSPRDPRIRWFDLSTATHREIREVVVGFLRLPG